MTARPFGSVPVGATGKPKPFTLHVSDGEITAFRTFLEYSKIGPETWESKHEEFGVSREWLVRAKHAWLSEFDWRKHEKAMNSLPNFRIEIEDAKAGSYCVHFVALFSTRVDAIPILCLHGWSGSFQEFLPMLSLLASKYSPETLPYHVIVPSLPGYVLTSGGSLDHGFTMDDCSRIMNRLMVELGFGIKGYIAQGGDVGSFVARDLAEKYEACKAVHLNLLYLAPEVTPRDLEGLTVEEAQRVRGMQQWSIWGTGYHLEQATRPATIGAVLSASPLSLLAWIGEKFLEAVDDRQPLPLETILGHVSLYWFTETLPRSLWPYRGAVAGIRLAPLTNKPLGYSNFPKEVYFLPRSWGEKFYPHMVRYEHDKVGSRYALHIQPRFTDEMLTGYRVDILPPWSSQRRFYQILRTLFPDRVDFSELHPYQDAILELLHPVRRPLQRRLGALLAGVGAAGGFVYVVVCHEPT